MLCFCVQFCLAQADSVQAKPDALELKASIEPYAAISPPLRTITLQRHPIFSTYPLANGFDVHLAAVRGSWRSDRVEGRLGLMAGSFAQRNMNGVPESLQFLQEASVHLALNENKTFFTGIGIQPSHIGSEGIFGFENMMLTRSLAADNSPYFQNGLYLKWAPSKGKLECSLWALNGWQRVLPGISKSPVPAAGWQVQYRPAKNLVINSSSYWGNVPGGSKEARRLFHNLYLKGGNSEKLEWMLCLDAGLQIPSMKDIRTDSYWATLNINCSLHTSKRHALQFRAELFRDPTRVILNLPVKSTDVAGFTLGNQIKVNPWCLIRNEYKVMLFDVPPAPYGSETRLGSFTCALLVYPTLYKK